MENTKNITIISTIKDRFAIITALILTLLIGACTTTLDAPQKRLKNLSYLYNPDNTHLHPEYQVYNHSQEASTIYCKIHTSDLMYRKNADGRQYGYLKLKYVLYQSLTSGGILDSASFVTPFQLASEKGISKVLKFNVKSPYLSKSFLKITITDVVSERKRTDYVNINKTGSFNRQSVLIKDQQNKTPLFGNELLIGNTYNLEAQLFDSSKWMICEQNTSHEIASVPYLKKGTSEAKANNDTCYHLIGKELEVLRKSNLILTFDTSQNKNVLLLALDSTSNYLHTPTQMIKPLSYLLSSKEYKTMLSSENKKMALDRFWLKVGKNTRVAGEMIKVFYHRVSLANRYFTSFKEGWKTDRGMIYTIYGEPTTVYKSDKIERWIYGSEESLVFDFLKKYHPHSDNHYILERSEVYRKSWSQAVDSWRNGRIFSITK